MINDLGIPFIYDDNEHWAQYAKVIYEITNSKNSSRIGKWLTKQMKKRAISLWPTWEKEIVSSHALRLAMMFSIMLDVFFGITAKQFLFP